MTVTVGIIIGVTLFFTVCSIVLSRRPRDADEYALAAKPAAWERKGGSDLTSPIVGAEEPEVVEAPRFLTLTPPEGSRMRPAELMTTAPAAVATTAAAAPVAGGANAAAAAEEGPALTEEVVRGLEQIPPLPKAV